MRWLTLVLGFMVVSACGSSSEPESTLATTSTTQTNAPTTTLPRQLATTSSLGTSTMVVAERPISPEESQRLDDDESAGILDCENEGGFTWDWGPIDQTSPRGREATDALADALTDINEDADEDGYARLPLTGWTALTGEGRVEFVLIDGGAWLANVSVGGAPDIGVWRHFSAVVCPFR